MCNKARYSTKQAAQKDARMILYLNGKNSKFQRLTPYHCLHCNWWHLTSKKQLNKTQKKARRRIWEKKQILS